MHYDTCRDKRPAIRRRVDFCSPIVYSFAYAWSVHVLLRRQYVEISIYLNFTASTGLYGLPS